MNRRIARIRTHFELLQIVLKQPMVLSLPADFELMGFEQSVQGVFERWCWIIGSSESFPPIPEGGLMSEISL